MARTVTAGTLATRVRERADLENSDFISDAELYRYIDGSYTELYDKLVQADPERYMKFQTLTGDGSTTDFACASDYMSTVRLDFQDNSDTGVYYVVPRIFGAEATDLHHTEASVPCGWHPVYNTSAPTTPMIRILPPPEAQYTMRHCYVVAPSTLDSSDDAIDGVSGWEEYIVIDAAIKCRIKEESATADLERQLAKLDDRLNSMIEARNISAAGRVIDTRGPDDAPMRPVDPANYWSRRPW